MKILATALCAAALVAASAPADARTKLVTLPDRAKLLASLEHPYQSLLSEERELTLQQGANQIDFSWQGVAIDPSSIRLFLLDHPGEGPDATKIISVAFPPGEQALTWQLYSPAARTERIRVVYLLSGISRAHQYDLTVDAAETKGLFRQYFQMTNQSGEDLDNAAFRIAQNPQDLQRSVDSGETRRFLALEAADLPVTKLFIARPDPYSQRGDDGEAISMVYEIENSAAKKLGGFKLDPGKARIFAEDPDGSTIFLGEDNLPETAVQEKAELALGTVRDVLLKRRIMRDEQEVKRTNNQRRPVLADRHVHLRYEVENFKDAPATVRVVERIPAGAEVREHDTDGVSVLRKDATTLEVTITLPPRPADQKEKVPVKEVNLKYEEMNVRQ
ncbi:MAG: hypothetical protein SF028_09400 [Candidatus Sumerlaeia bacterium]|nr:hypothetical protein [Candidatus Sumerlaeia bacterium]